MRVGGILQEWLTNFVGPGVETGREYCNVLDQSCHFWLFFYLVA